MCLPDCVVQYVLRMLIEIDQPSKNVPAANDFAIYSLLFAMYFIVDPQAGKKTLATIPTCTAPVMTPKRLRDSSGMYVCIDCFGCFSLM